MPMLGSNLSMRLGSGPKYTYLDWATGNGAIVMTDYQLDTITHPMETVHLVTADDPTPPDDPVNGGNWAAVVAAGCQNEPAGGKRGLFFVCCGSNEGVMKPVAWMNDIIGFPPYDRSHTNGCYFTDQTTFKSFLLYKEADDAADNIVMYIDGVRRVVEYPHWTTATVSNVPQPVSFFGTKSLDGRYTQKSHTTRLKRFTIYDTPDGMTPIASFVPVMLKDVAGMLEEVSGKFYPEEAGKLTCCLDGVVLPR